MGTEALDPIVHQQVRLQVLVALARNGHATFTDLRDGLGLTPGNLQAHAMRLIDAGYVRARPVFGRGRFELRYDVTDEGRTALRRYLGALRGILGAQGAGLSGHGP